MYHVQHKKSRGVLRVLAVLALTFVPAGATAIEHASVSGPVFNTSETWSPSITPPLSHSDWRELGMNEIGHSVDYLVEKYGFDNGKAQQISTLDDVVRNRYYSAAILFLLILGGVVRLLTSLARQFMSELDQLGRLL
jgi:hypothetical protein